MMGPKIDTSNPQVVAREIQAMYLGLFPDANPFFVAQSLEWLRQSFAGQYAGYLPIDTHYHDLEHTLEVSLCMVQILHRRQQLGGQPVLNRKFFELGLLAILLHDTGYLKSQTDTEGTGGKYTFIHVERSASFARQLLSDNGFDEASIKAVQNMIHCTGLNVNLNLIPFDSELEKIVGCALGSGDLLGQMAADNYPDKLPALFEEFNESAHFMREGQNHAGAFESVEDLLRKTPSFWKHYVLPKLQVDFLGLYRFLNDPYPDGPNYYLRKIEDNLDRLHQQLSGLQTASA